MIDFTSISLASFSLMLQVLQSVIDDFDLFLDNGHSPREFVVAADFLREVLDLGIHDRL